MNGSEFHQSQSTVGHGLQFCPTQKDRIGRGFLSTRRFDSFPARNRYVETYFVFIFRKRAIRLSMKDCSFVQPFDSAFVSCSLLSMHYAIVFVRTLPIFKESCVYVRSM